MGLFYVIFLDYGRSNKEIGSMYPLPFFTNLHAKCSFASYIVAFFAGEDASEFMCYPLLKCSLRPLFGYL